MENGITNLDKLLICLAIILLLTIVWTILIGIMYKLKEGGTTTSKISKSKLLLDADDEDEVITVKKTSKKTNKTRKTRKTRKTTKKKTTSTKKTSTRSASRTTPVVKSNTSNQEVYVKVRFYGTKKDLIYVAPENVILSKGEKIKVRTDEGNIRTATVKEGNYLREKYKTYEYQTLELVD